MKDQNIPAPEQKYMLAIVPGEPVVSALTSIKDEIAKYIEPNEYQPPHITLFPSFTWSDKEEYLLVHHIKNVMPHLYSFEVNIHGIACNRDKKTIYAPTQTGSFFNDCHEQFRNYFIFSTVQQGTNFDEVSGQLVLANGDLKADSLSKAWNKVKHIEFDGSFYANEIALLKKEPGGWSVFRQFHLD